MHSSLARAFTGCAALLLSACTTALSVDGDAGTSDASDDGARPAHGDGGAGQDGGTADAALTWYATCGDPVCRAPVGDAGSDAGSDAGVDVDGGLPKCTTQHIGEPCSTPGAECDPGGSCGGLLRCTDQDPTKPGCPVSSRAFKQNVAYLGEEEIARVAREVEAIRLARYAYKGDPDHRHLGFVLEDQAPRDAVVPAQSMIDLYGYTSMVVAALQDQRRVLDVQAREIASLRHSVSSLRASCATKP
jgi:hypothetical protein